MKPTTGLLFLTGLFFGCAPSSNWQLTSISMGDKGFDSARLRYSTEDHLGGMNLEFFCTDGALTGYLSTPSRRFSSKSNANAFIRMQNETIEIPLALHEGCMRLRIPDDVTTKVALALQEEQPITIVVGSLEQTFQAEQFSPLFHKLTEKSNRFFGSFQGTLP